MSTHAHFRPPPARNEPVARLRAGQPRARARSRRASTQMAGERIEVPLVIGGKDIATGDTRTAVMPHDKEHVLADVHQGERRARRSRRSTPPPPRGRTGRAGRGRTAPPSSSAPPSCSPARGATRSTRPRCSASRRPRTRPRSTRPASSIDFLRFNVEFMTRIYSEQPVSSPGVWNRHGVPAARGLRARRLAVQLHRDRRQPDQLAGADGERRRSGSPRRPRCSRPTT